MDPITLCSHYNYYFMKKINFRFSGLFIVLLCVFSTQLVSAKNDIIIRKDDDTGFQPNNVLSAARTMSVSSRTFIPVNADIIGNDLIVDFSSSVGTVFVSIVDNTGNVVYQNVVDTYNTSELIIPIDNLSSGKYSLKFSYSATNLIGIFQL